MLPEMPSASRVKHTFKLPKSLHQYGITSMTFIELTPAEELMAVARAQNDPIKLALQSGLQSLTAINGTEVSLSDGSADKAWATMHPKVRTLAMTAYSDIHNPKPDETKDFLSSRDTEVQ